MFRVPQDTVLRRVAAASLIALTTALAACGGSDGGDQAVVPATSPTTPQTTPDQPTADETAAQSAAVQKEAKKAAKEAAKAADGADLSAQTEANQAAAKAAVAGNVKKVTDKPESPDTIKAASGKKETQTTLEDDVAAAKAALDKAGQPATKVQMSGSVGAAIQVQNTTIVFYASEKKAAKNAETFANAIAANPDYGRISRTANRLYLLSVATKITDKDTAAFDEVRKVVDGAL